MTKKFKRYSHTKGNWRKEMTRAVLQGCAEVRKRCEAKEGWYPNKYDAHMLMWLHTALWDDYVQARNARLQYLALKERIKELSENGRIAVVYGFRDCDMAESDGNVRIINANLGSLRRWAEDFHSDAEGPQWYDIERVSVAKQIRRSSRDLALEAFEDGHSHIVSSVRFDEEGEYHV